MPDSDDVQEPENSGEEEIPEDISPEDLAREVTEGLEEEGATPTGEEPAEAEPTDDTSREDTEDTGETTGESPDEEEEPETVGDSGEDSPASGGESSDQEVSPEDLAAEAAEDVEPSGGEEPAAEEEQTADSAEETTEQEEAAAGEETASGAGEAEASEDAEPAEEPTGREEQPAGDDREAAEEQPESPPADEGEEIPSAGEEEGETETEEIAPEDAEDEEEGSIKDILEEEATRAREEPGREEEEEEEAELPGGYLTGDQLPEEEEFTVPPWLKTTAKLVGILLLLWLIISYLVMPGLEAFLYARMSDAFRRDAPELARLYGRAGLFMDGLLIKNPDQFRGAYLKYLLESEQLPLFREEYEELAPLEPTPRTLQVYGQYLLQQGRWEEAYELAIELQQFHVTRGLGFLFAGRAQLNLGDYSGAETAASRARGDRPRDPEVFRLERDISLQQGQFERAQSSADELFALAAEDEALEVNAHDYVQLGKIHREQGNISAAVEMYENAISLEPYQPEALSYLVRHFTLEERWGRVEDYLDGPPGRGGYRAAFPYDALGWWAEAELEFQRGNTERAVVLVERALDLQPRNREANRVLGLVHLDGFEEPRLALRYLESARDFNLDRFEFMNQLARAYFESELYLEAVAVYYELDERLEEELATVWYNIGTSYLGAHQLDSAEEYLELAYEMGYREAEIYNQRGLLYELRGEVQQAFEMYWEGIEILEDAGEDVTLIRNNLDRAFAAEDPVPLADWIGSVERELR